MKKTLLTLLATTAAISVTTASAETVQIANAADWASFATRVNNGRTSLNAEMIADVTLSNDSPRIGNVEARAFAGTFNGNGYTLRLNWNTNGVNRLAPFSWVSGAVISNLHTSGNITTDETRSSGLIGQVKSNGATISRCRSSVRITGNINGDVTAGGFIGCTSRESQTVTIRDCLFDGSLLCANGKDVGGFVGFSYDESYVNIYSSLCAPQEVELSTADESSKTFVRGNGGQWNISGSYYKTTVGTAQGTDASSMSAQDLATALGGNWTVSAGKVMPKALDRLYTATIELLKNGETFSTQGFGNIIDWSTDKGTWTTCNTSDSHNYVETYYYHVLSTLSQTVTLADFGITANDLQSSDLVVTASVMAMCRGLGSEANNVKVYQLDANGDVISTHLVMDRPGPTFDETEYSLSFTLDADARKLKYELNAMSVENDDSTLRGPLFRSSRLRISMNFISFVSEGAPTVTVSYQDFSSLTPPTVSRDGCRFIGYFTQATGGEQVFDESYARVNGSTWTPTEGATLYAHWMLSDVNFSFVSAGATLGTADYDTSGSAPTAPVATRRGNDRFLGYFTEQSGGTQVFDENYEFVLADTSILTDPNMTLYAQWKVVPTKLEGGITRLVYRGVLTNFGEWSSGLRKTMHVKVYDSASATTALWSGDAADVPINPDGSFEAVFGNDELALAFASNDVTHVELTVGDSLSPLAPRRAFASVASVNRALVAEGAASDIKVGTLGANAIVAEKITAASLEASEMVRVEGSVSVEVKPFDIERGRETTIWRGAGVSAWGESKHIRDFDNVVAGQFLWTADSDGVVMIHCSGSTRSTLRIPATIQFVRPGDEVRAPTYENGKVSVTFWSYKK